jgi:hypothetical protein
VAADTGRIAYSVYDEDRYEIYSIDDLEKLAGCACWSRRRAPPP